MSNKLKDVYLERVEAWACLKREREPIKKKFKQTR